MDVDTRDQEVKLGNKKVTIWELKIIHTVGITASAYSVITGYRDVHIAMDPQ